MGYEALVVLIFIACLFGGVYWYAGYSTKTGSAVDENQNFIPDSWEKNFGWFLWKRYHHACTWYWYWLCTCKKLDNLSHHLSFFFLNNSFF